MTESNDRDESKLQGPSTTRFISASALTDSLTNSASSAALSHLTTELAKSDSKVVEAYKRIDVLSAENGGLCLQVDGLKVQNAGLHQWIDVLSAELAAIKSQQEKALSATGCYRCGTPPKEVCTSACGHLFAVESVEALGAFFKQKELTAENANLDAKIIALYTEIEAGRNTCEARGDQIEELTSALTQVRAIASEQQAELAALTDRNGLKVELTELAQVRAIASEQQAELAALTKRYNNRGSHIKALVEDRDNLRTKLADVHERLASSEDARADAESEKVKGYAAIAEHERKNAELLVERDGLKAELAALTDRYNNRVSHIKALRDNIRTKLADVHERLARITAEVTALVVERDGLKVKLTELAAKRNVADSDSYISDTLRAMLADRDDQIGGLKTDADLTARIHKSASALFMSDGDLVTRVRDLFAAKRFPFPDGKPTEEDIIAFVKLVMSGCPCPKLVKENAELRRDSVSLNDEIARLSISLTTRGNAYIESISKESARQMELADKIVALDRDLKQALADREELREQVDSYDQNLIESSRELRQARNRIDASELSYAALIDLIKEAIKATGTAYEPEYIKDAVETVLREKRNLTADIDTLQAAISNLVLERDALRSDTLRRQRGATQDYEVGSVWEMEGTEGADPTWHFNCRCPNGGDHVYLSANVAVSRCARCKVLGVRPPLKGLVTK